MIVSKAINYFSKFSLNQLRKYQTINEQQIKLAFEQRKDLALERLQNMAIILQEAIILKIFYDNDYIELVAIGEKLSSVDFDCLI